MTESIRLSGSGSTVSNKKPLPPFTGENGFYIQLIACSY